MDKIKLLEKINTAHLNLAKCTEDNNWSHLIFAVNNLAEVLAEIVSSPVDPTQAAAALGSIKSEPKAEASRRNGAKGGRPRKSQ